MRRGILRRPVESSGTVPGGVQERFAGFDAIGEVEHWDATTAGVVLARLGPPPPLRFFNLAEEATGRALFHQILDQRGEPTIPVLEMVDARLAEGVTDGYRFAPMPEDGDAFRQSFAALDADAEDAFGKRFALLEWHDQTDLLQAIHDTKGDWHGLPAHDVWDLWTRYACAAFYSHPWAWNEIGFGGPAYPRGYKNIGVDAREPWEVADRTGLDPVGRGEEIEHARARHAQARTRQLEAADPKGPTGVGDRLSEHR
jgi:hypothetical protein